MMWKFRLGQRVDISTYDGVWGKAVVLERRVDTNGNRDYRVKMDKREDWTHPDFWAFEFEVTGIPVLVQEAVHGDGSRWEEIS
jgi:hypothetical protein